MGLRPRGCPRFLLAGDLEGNASFGSPPLFGHFPKCLRHSVSISENASNPLRAFPEESPVPFTVGSAQMISKIFLVNFLMCLGIDLGISFTFPLKQRVPVY